MYGVGMEEPSTSKTDKINQYLDLVMDHPALLAYVRFCRAPFPLLMQPAGAGG